MPRQLPVTARAAKNIPAQRLRVSGPVWPVRGRLPNWGSLKEEFERAVPDLVKIAFEDPSWRPTNPRMPLMNELADLLWAAYRGRSAAKAVRVPEQEVAKDGAYASTVSVG